MTNAEVFRPRSGYILAGILIAGSILLVLQTLLYSTGEDLWATIFWAVSIVFASYWLFIHPKVTVYDEGITIHNPFRVISVSWAHVEDIDVQYSMSITVAGRKIHAFAAPAPGRYHARTIHPNEIKGLRVSNPENMRPGESPRTHSGVATHLARLRYEAFHKGNFANATFNESFDRNGVLAIASLIVGCIIAWLL